ncbi:MAG: hypothetical protein JRI56_00015 [Deltaproteobacteria bacterium]|nr:hypothetical protein [Deltaproteobacteria bacterium]
MNQEDRDILIEVHNDVKWIKKLIETHFSEHFKIRLALFGSVLAAATAIMIALM